MTYVAEVICDSIANGVRLTTFKVRYPHAVHKDMLRHREQSPVYESFRAQPPENIIAAIERGEGFRPEVFGKRTKGMGQRNEAIDGEAMVDQKAMRTLWDTHVMRICGLADEFLEQDIAKQQVNFLLQDLADITGLITATSWDNFFALRLELKPDGSPMARPEVYKIASMMKDALDASTPKELKSGDWHLPLVDRLEYEADLWSAVDAAHVDEICRYWAMISAGRCARVSYARQDESEAESASYLRAKMLLANGHMSPFEQQARPLTTGDLYGYHTAAGFTLAHKLSISITDVLPFTRATLDPSEVSCGNFKGWAQHRKLFDCEENYAELKATMEIVS